VRLGGVLNRTSRILIISLRRGVACLHGLQDMQAIEPVHVAAYIEALQLQMTAPSQRCRSEVRLY
jgi:hypothetical protein